jgi:4-diphosphocytidyl-2-C-methyl-D-erythritol kinase
MGFSPPLVLPPMLSERHADTVVVWAPAKVNLYLEVLAKRADGYHEIATLMVAVSLYDTLEFKEEASGEIQLRCDHPDVPAGADNLVCRAASLLQRHTGHKRGARIHLTKRIPLAAGLAGGSTDAAATLAGLNRLWRLGLTGSQLATLAAELGSDVAFFFSTPAAWCTGRGERVTPVPLARSLIFVLVCPPIGLATAEVYRGVTVPELPQTGAEICQAVADGDREEIGRQLHNRLQPVAERLCPEVAVVRNWLESMQPAGHLMSGSGTSLFALCRDIGQAVTIARKLRHGPEEGPRPRVFMGRSCF